MTSHYNRNNRRSGGNRKFSIPCVDLTQDEKIKLIVAMKIEKHPDWTMQQIADWATDEFGLHPSKVVEILTPYCED